MTLYDVCAIEQAVRGLRSVLETAGNVNEAAGDMRAVSEAVGESQSCYVR